MNSVMVRGIRIGEGIPKICVPIMGKTRDNILKSAQEAVQAPKDLVEWRSDWYEDVMDLDKVGALLCELRGLLEDTPLIFTFRTATEGGEGEVSQQAYRNLNVYAAETGFVDLIDLELLHIDEGKEILEKIHGCGVLVIGSNHDFQKTPDQEDLIQRLCSMQELGADILKIAVMPQRAKDVLVLLSATEEMVSQYAERPVVSMSMSGKGVVSRIAGEVFGSAITFGALEQGSAPGQLPVEELKMLLDVIHKSV